MEKKKSDKKKIIIIIVAVVVGLASIPFFIGIIEGIKEVANPPEESSTDEVTTITQPETEVMTSSNDNVQKLIDATGKNIKYCEDVFEFMKSLGLKGISTVKQDDTTLADGASEFTFSTYEFGTETGSLILDDAGVYYLSFGGNILYSKEDSEAESHLINEFMLDSSDKGTLINYTKNYVKKYLKSPSTAKFPSTLLNGDEWRFGIFDGAITVCSYVESQNSFGAIVRTDFIAEYDIYKNLISLTLDGEKIYM